MSDVTAVIPTFNRRDLLERVLRDLNRQTHAVKQILVVDDGSTDGSAAVAEGAGAQVLRMSGNSGFARAVNGGIREAGTPLIAILNNDVELAETWLAELVSTVESSDAMDSRSVATLRSNPMTIRHDVSPMPANTMKATASSRSAQPP